LLDNEDKKELEFILDRVRRHEDSRQPYIQKANKWEKMYRLDPGFNRTLQQAVASGQEQVVLPTPFNAINLSQRLLSTSPRIDVIPLDPIDKNSVEYAEQCEKWLTAMWTEINAAHQRNILGDATWQVLALGRFALEIKWIKDEIPKRFRNQMLPIRIRTLEPRKVGIRRGPIVTEFAYYIEEEMPLLEVLREWKTLADDAPSDSKLYQLIEQQKRNNYKDEETTVRYIDYWQVDPEEGTVQNAVMVDDCYAKKLSDTDYPEIPIVVGRGDYAVGLGDDYDGLSILHPLEGLWEYECRLTSQMATALLWHFWPAITVQNEQGQPVEDIDISPGTTSPVPWGTKIDMHRIEPNVPLAQAVYNQIEQYVQQSTYPEVMYGQAPGDLQAGYGVSLLSDSAKGRVKNYQESLEMGLEHAHRVVLGLIDAFGGSKGVDIYTVDEKNDENLKLSLNKKMIKGIRQTKVRISPAVPQDNAARVSMGLQIANAKYISAQTFLDKFLDVNVPTDETKRLALEELMQSDEMRPYRLRRAAEEFYGAESLDVLFGTPFMPEPPPGFEWTKGDNGQVQLTPTEPPPPPGPGPDDPMPMEPPPEGPPGMDPMGGPPIQPEMPIPGPMGGSSIPPVMQGQFEGETLGLPQDMDPMLFDQMMNTPGSVQEQIRMAGGLPPSGTIPGVV
jgi:hypothetical protein